MEWIGGIRRICLIRLKERWLLVGFFVPAVVIGYCVVIPASFIASVNDLSVGFGATVAGACLAYWLGQRAALASRRA